MPRATLLLIPVVSISIAACQPQRAYHRGFNSADPASKLHAIRQAGSADDHAAIPALIEQLDSDDPAVRMLAITALERITGTRRGYDPYAPRSEREPTVNAWTEAATKAHNR